MLSLARVYEQGWRERGKGALTYHESLVWDVWPQFAYEPEPSFRVALNALGGMEDSAAVAAMALLDLEADATPADVRAAYRKTAAQWHPDKFATKPPEERDAAQRTFQRVRVLTSTCTRVDEHHATNETRFTGLIVSSTRAFRSLCAEGRAVSCRGKN